MSHHPAHRQPPNRRLSRWRTALLAAIAGLSAAVGVGVATIPPAHAQVACLQNMSYVSTETGSQEAFVRSNCGTVLAQMPHDVGMILYDAAVAPDGHTVAITLGFPASPPFNELFLGDLNGGPVTQLTFLGGIQHRPTWSPDGRTIGFYHDEQRTPSAVGAYTYSLDAQTWARVAPGLAVIDSPSFSPDGSLMALAVNDPAQGYGVWTIATTPGATPTPVLKNFNATGVTFTPDSQFITFSGSDGTTQGLWGTDLAGRAFQLLADAQAFNANIAPDWTMYFESIRGSDTEEHIYGLWLGGTTVQASVDNAGRQIEPTTFGGQASLRPANFPPGGGGSPGPSPSATSPLPSPTGFGLKDVRITAARNDRVLTRRIDFVPNNSTPVARYEYAWASTPTGTTPGAAIQRCAITIAVCRLNYGPTYPETTHNLLARLVATNGTVSSWFVKPIKIPPAFHLVLLADSVAAGHHRDSEGAPTICQDETYSYGQTIWNELEAQVPPQWRLAHGYLNVAHSGFGTAQALFGGVDACGDTHEAELPEAIKVLKENAGSWNRVVVTAGINDTNWGDVLGAIIGANFASQIKTPQQCQVYVSKWNFLSDPLVGSNITANVRLIANQIEAADPQAHENWTSYYNIAGTGTLKLKVPSVCAAPMAKGIKAFHTTLRAGLASTQFVWVDIDSVLGMKDALLQQLYPTDTIFRNSGWPHPNRRGAVLVGKRVLAF